MAFWKPYAEEVLDLSKTSKQHTVPVTPPLQYSPERFLHPEFKNHEVPVTPSPPLHYPEDLAQQLTRRSSMDSIESWASRSSCDIDEPLDQNFEYQMFERNALRVMAEQNGGTLTASNPRMRRAVKADVDADDSYRRQREKNNMAAKQSRDRRKMREWKMGLQVTFLKMKLAEMQALAQTRVCQRCRQNCVC